LFCIHIEKVTGNYLEWEERIGPDGQLGSYAKKPEDVPEWVDDATHEDISRRKWDVVHRCLSRGNAAAELASARRRHAMKMAAFEPCEGRHYLLDLMDPEFFDGWKKYQREQHRYS
jgi:hypothetical protein